MKARDKGKRHDVMLAADVGSYSITTISLAVQLAASMKSRLRGLFIEDEDLLQMSGLPITREISLTTARERPTDVDAMQRSIQVVARQFEQALKQEAGALKIKCSFDCVRGRVRDLGLQHGADVTYVILGQPVSHRLRPRPERAPRRILLVANRSPHQKRALDVVLQSFGREKVIITLVDDEPGGKLSTKLAQLQQSGNGRIRMNRVGREQLFEQLARVGSGFDCAIVSRHEGIEVLQRMVKSLSCPVILVA